MTLPRTLGLVSAVLITLAAAEARAAIITFEGASGFASAVGQFIDVDGFRFTLNSIGSGNGFVVITNQADVVEAGTTKLDAANHVEITMTMIGGGAFNLLSLDIGGSFIASPIRWASSVNVFNGVSTVNVVLPPNDPTYQSAVPNFLNVTSVTFIPLVNANGGVNNFEFTLDNIEVTAGATAVPEPATLLLLSAGLGAVILRRRWSERG